VPGFISNKDSCAQPENAPADGHTSTLRLFPHTPGDLAAKSPTAVNGTSSQISSFLINIPAVPEAFNAAESSTARTTFSAPEYFKKFAAVHQDAELELLGFP